MARHRQEKREATRLGKLLSHTEASVEFCEATPIGPVDEPKESCTGARRTETCIPPINSRYLDAPRDFYFLFSPNEQRGGGELPDFLILFYFPCSADQEWDGHRLKYW